MSETSAGNRSTNCPHCGAIHSTTCPLIKAIEYHQNGSVKRIEFKTASDYPQAMTINDWLGVPSVVAITS